ncbi:MAG: DUF1858 domain-containing protein [Acidobacteria bacterium]|nr:DUF1858 domain-containing protein [Acidobacteriota bacterium]
MLVNPETRVGPLLDAHPELEDVLIGLSPEFRRLRNPILRRTVARVATLAQVAKVGGLPVPDVVNALRVALGQAAGGCDAHAAPDEPAWPAWAEAAAPPSWLAADAVLAAGGTPGGPLAAAAATAAPGTVLGLRAGFYPAPLVDTLRGKGHEIAARQVGERWEIVVRVG